jgi:hypothetical protein
MVYGTIKQHDGFISVSSEPGRGTTFNIYLPLTGIHERQTKDQPAAAITSGNETILLVEDDESVMKVTRTILEGLGYTVIEAANGEQAIERFRENAGGVHLVVSDMIMPGLSGKDVQRELSRIQPDIKILYISGYTADILKQKGMEGERLNFVSKPLQPDDLSRKIREVLDEPDT